MISEYKRCKNSERTHIHTHAHAHTHTHHKHAVLSARMETVTWRLAFVDRSQGLMIRQADTDVTG